MSDLEIKCEVCQSLLDEEDMFCANCGTEAPKRAAAGDVEGDSARVAKHNFECSGCGASMSYNARSEALQCPFCGSVDMVEQGDAKILAPKRVVPFKLGQDEAETAMREWLGRGFWRPGDLSQQAAVEKMSAVYVPYWVFQATTHTHWTADTNRTPPGARGDWFPLSGEHHGSYSGLLIGASGALTARETSEICPFDMAAGMAPGEVDLESVTVEQFSMPRKYARPLARQGLEDAETRACAEAYVPGKARNVHVNVRIGKMSSEPVLLPVWIMAYRFRDKVYRFLVNGQTGQATGGAPLSWTKILVAAVIAIVVLLALLLVCSGVLGGAMGRGTEGPCTPAVQIAAAAPGGTGVSPVHGQHCRNIPGGTGVSPVHGQVAAAPPYS